MQPVSVTRQSGFMAMMTVIAILAVSYVRMSLSPHAAEAAECPFPPRPLEIAAAVLLSCCAAMAACRTAITAGMLKSFDTTAIPLFGIVAVGIYASPYALNASAAALCTAMALLLLVRNIPRPDEKASVFFAGMLLGGAVAFYPPTVTLSLLIPISIVILPLSPRQCLLAATGWVLPLLAASYVNWYAGAEFGALASNIWEMLATRRPTEFGPFPFAATALVAAFAATLAAGPFVGRAGRSKMLIKERKAIGMAVSAMVLSLAAFAIPGCGTAMLNTAACPAAILAATSLSRMPRKVSNPVYWGVLILFVVHLFFE